MSASTVQGNPHISVGTTYCRDYECEVNCRKITGIVALVVSAAMLIFAVILAAGVFGGGEMGFLAGGLTVGSMLTLGLALVLLLPKKENALFDMI